MLRNSHFKNNWINKVDRVNQHELGESYCKLYSLFIFNGSHYTFLYKLIYDVFGEIFFLSFYLLKYTVVFF